jgi:glucokinase
MVMSEVIIGVDLGGTRIRSARLSYELDILAREETLTDAEEGLGPTLERIKAMIRKVWPHEKDALVAGIGISAPGPLNPATGVVVSPPNLKGWHNVPLADILREAFGVPVFVGNDANVAGLAETIRGAAQGCRHVIFITVSTGIGGGIITDGRLLLGKDGLGAEVGHVVMLVGDRVSSLEKEAAGPALARQARERLAKGEQSSIRDMVKGNLDAIDGAVVGHAAQQGDRMALEIVRYAGQVLGYGIASFLHLFNPEIIVIGGGVSKLGELLFEPMRAAMKAGVIDPAYWQTLRIERAALGDNVSIIGAAALVVTQGGQSDISDVVARLAKVKV